MIHQSGLRLHSDELARLVASDLKQSEKVMKVFYNRPEFGYTAEQIHLIAFDSSTPITSIRRCLSDLAKKGTLIKDESNKVKGKYGIGICQYRLTSNQIKLF